jgi:hypothetical protein
MAQRLPLRNRLSGQILSIARKKKIVNLFGVKIGYFHTKNRNYRLRR